MQQPIISSTQQTPVKIESTDLPKVQPLLSTPTQSQVVVETTPVKQESKPAKQNEKTTPDEGKVSSEKDESFVVTADYIQQSMLLNCF